MVKKIAFNSFKEVTEQLIKLTEKGSLTWERKLVPVSKYVTGELYLTRLRGQPITIKRHGQRYSLYANDEQVTVDRIHSTGETYLLERLFSLLSRIYKEQCDASP